MRRGNNQIDLSNALLDHGIWGVETMFVKEPQCIDNVTMLAPVGVTFAVEGRAGAAGAENEVAI